MPSKKKLNPKSAAILKDVPAENAFWICNGWVMRNISDLPKALENMNDETYAYHVNADKNDFSNWLRDVVGDKILASTLRKVKNRHSAVESTKRRIRQLKR